jgi:hypothetical protein
MGDTRQSLSWMRERAWFQISAFILFFILIRGALLGAFSYLFGFFGINPDWVSDTLHKNEVGIQIFTFILTEMLLGLLSQRRGFLVDFAFLRRVGEIAWTDLLTSFSGKFFIGFLAASAAIGISVFSGLSVLESPADWFSLLLVALPKILVQCAEIILWFICLELFRYPLWSKIAPESSARLQGRLLLIFFQGWLIYLLVAGGELTSDWRIFSFIVSIWLSTQIFLWAETSWTLNATRNFWPNLLSRVGFCSGFLISLIHVYGLPSGGRHEVSLVYSLEGPSLLHLADLNFDSILGQAPVLAVLFGLATILVRRSAQSLNRAR